MCFSLINSLTYFVQSPALRSTLRPKRSPHGLFACQTGFLLAVYKYKYTPVTITHTPFDEVLNAASELPYLSEFVSCGVGFSCKDSKVGLSAP